MLTIKNRCAGAFRAQPNSTTRNGSTVTLTRPAATLSHRMGEGRGEGAIEARVVLPSYARAFLCLLALAAFVAGCAPPGPRALREGKELIDRGRYAEAVEKLKLATSLLSTNAQAWNYLGLACQYAGQSTNAVQAYQKALALNQDLAEAHFNLGCLWLEQNRLDQARGELISYTSLRKNSLEGWLKLGATHLRSARVESHAAAKPAVLPARSPELAAAEVSYQEALRIKPLHPEALNGLGLVQLYRSRPREAAQCFGNALKQEPDYGPALLNLAVVSQHYLNDRELALQKYREYLALPGQTQDRESVTLAVRQLERELHVASISPTANSPALTSASTTTRGGGPRGSDVAAKADRTAPAAASPAERVGKGETVKSAAEPASRPAKDSTPPQPAAPGAQAGQTKVAVTSPQTGEEKTTKDKPGFFSRLNPLRLLRSEAKAVEPTNTVSLEATAPAAPEDSGDASAPGGSGRYKYRSPAKPVAGNHSAAERAFSQGLQAQQASRLPDAVQSYRRAAQLDPAYYDAYYNLALAAGSAGNLQPALVACEFALVLRPESADARYNFALLLRQANYVVDAANELERLLSIYPREPRGHLALGNLYAQQLRQPAKAREHYLKVLEYDPHNAQAAAIRYWLIANPP
jgi:tetratricopeptide (TPR) repeat protein